MQEKDKQNKVPSSLKVVIEARRKSKESMKAAMPISQRIAEVTKRQRESVELLRKLACPSLQITEMLEQVRRQQQQVFAGIADHLKNFTIPDYTSGIRQMMIQLNFSNPVVEALKQSRQAFGATNMFKSIIEEQREAQMRIARALKPAFQMNKNIAAKLARVDWQSISESLSASLQDYRPEVEVHRDALVIEDEQFSQEDINQIAEEYIWDENSDKNIFKQDGKHLSWENIPKPVRWLIALVVATIFAIYFTPIWNELTKDTALSPERVTRRFIHFRKQEVRQINKNHQINICPPFVNTEHLLVYTVPKKTSQTIAVLSYPCEIKILKFKKKKRWTLIEWEDELGETCQGWALARYIYRKNIKEK